jgi:hypothetical protein
MSAPWLLKWLTAPALIMVVALAVVFRPHGDSAPAEAQQENAMAVDALSGGSIDGSRTVFGTGAFSGDVVVSSTPSAKGDCSCISSLPRGASLDGPYASLNMTQPVSALQPAKNNA